jgi:methyl-accepting chemotaxis protein
MQGLPAAALASLLGRYVQKHEATLATLERVSEELQETSQNHLALGKEVAATSTAQISAFGKADQALQGATSSMERNREDAQRSRQLTNASEEAAREGREAASLLLSSIQNVDKTNTEVLETIASSHQDLDRIVKLINEIGSKTSVINDIVFQTKLLSFNASVEAARAGEHGRGFSVVAEEIGNLAKMSGDAAKEITKLLDDSVAEVKSTLSGTQERVDAITARGKGALTTGIATAQRCETTLATAAERAAEARALVEKFTDAGNEQYESLATAVEAVHRLGELARTSQSRAS